MYPAQTSLIPVQIALARFLEMNGWSGIFSNYPFWYLGTTPFRYLTGPILPALLVSLHQLLPSLSLLAIFFWLFSIIWIISGIGIYRLIKELGAEKPILMAILFVFGPIVPYLFRFSDGLYLLTFSVLPFVLTFYLKLLKSPKSLKLVILTIAGISLLILLDSLIIPTLIVGMVAILLATTNWEKIEQKLRLSFFIFLLALVISSFWYGPSYWLMLFAGPSWAGKGLGSVIVLLGKLIPAALAFIMAAFSVKIFRRRDTVRDFCFYWLTIFGLLTLMRFLSDPDFWLDWTAYGVELQLGIAMLLGLIISKIYNLKFYFLLFILYFLVLSFTFNKYVLGTIQKDITQTVEYKIGKELNQVVKSGERVFLSGTTVFWLNSLFDITQVRGGVDQVSVDPNWRQAAWEIREGQDPQKSLDWLRKLSISYLVVHTSKSAEYYHDFKYPEKFEKISALQRIYEDKGDIIYQVLPNLQSANR